jgi:hypothetical protein
MIDNYESCSPLVLSHANNRRSSDASGLMGEAAESTLEEVMAYCDNFKA